MGKKLCRFFTFLLTVFRKKIPNLKYVFCCKIIACFAHVRSWVILICSISTLLNWFSVNFHHACLQCYVTWFHINKPLFLIINMSWFKLLLLLTSLHTKVVAAVGFLNKTLLFSVEKTQTNQTTFAWRECQDPQHCYLLESELAGLRPKKKQRRWLLPPHSKQPWLLPFKTTTVSVGQQKCHCSMDARIKI